MLGAINIAKVPDVRCPTDGGASHCPDNWQMRHDFIIEGRPRPGRFNSLYMTKILYIDSEADFVMSNDMYDRGGELFNNYTSWMHYADRAEPDARIAIYPFKREFQSGSSTVNLQSGFATVCYHPSPERTVARLMVHQHGLGRSRLVHCRLRWREQPRADTR